LLNLFIFGEVIDYLFFLIAIRGLLLLNLDFLICEDDGFSETEGNFEKVAILQFSFNDADAEVVELRLQFFEGLIEDFSRNAI
jgi:hypothetical protein